ncbi:hypothetical protein ACKVE0_09545 [Acinetobacter albensis]|uniref:Uncharacterized protein n=1 Tax=Acinetobacter albensis TaxID=1673609 RepID=A0ABW9JVH6_9GAMM
MITKQFKIVNAIIAVLAIAAFIYFQYSMRTEELGGFKEGTEQYNGYRYAQDNSLKSADQCDDDAEVNPNKEFLEGCKTYFEHQEDALK